MWNVQLKLGNESGSKKHGTEIREDSRGDKEAPTYAVASSVNSELPDLNRSFHEWALPRDEGQDLVIQKACNLINEYVLS